MTEPAATAIGLEAKGTAGSALSMEAVTGAKALSMEAHPAWPMISRMPAKLTVSIPLKRFKVKDLLNLASGQTIESAWPETEDVPLKTGELQLCWGEFEVVERNMALRLTRLA
jgi:flagellar motor switch protein FliN/FliY